MISFQKDSADEASSKGAVVALADQPFGKFIIGALAIGLAALVVWQALSLALIRDTDAKGWFKRLSAVTTMVIYAGLAFKARCVLRADQPSRAAATFRNLAAASSSSRWVSIS